MTAVTYTATRKIHANHTQSELVSNGDFAAGSTGWTATGWTVGSGVATHNTGNTSSLSQTLTGTVGYDYVVTFTISGTPSAGSLTPYIGTGSGVAVSSNGTYSQTITSETDLVLAFTPTTDFDGTIDDISVQVSSVWSMNISAAQLSENWPILKNTHISLDGTQETIFQRQDQVWDFTSTLITKANLTNAYWYEFLASVYAGETFSFDPYGTVASPDSAIDVVMVGEPSIVRDGNVGFFRVGFTVRQV